jgi:hypothetical protein
MEPSHSARLDVTSPFIPDPFEVSNQCVEQLERQEYSKFKKEPSSYNSTTACWLM